MVVFCALTVHNALSPFPPLCGHLPESRNCHTPAAIRSHALSSFDSNLLTNTMCEGTYLAGLVTILGTLNKPSHGVSKKPLRTD